MGVGAGTKFCGTPLVNIDEEHYAYATAPTDGPARENLDQNARKGIRFARVYLGA